LDHVGQRICAARRSSTRSTRNDKSQEGRPRTRLSTNGRFDRSNHARYRPDPLAREALAENFSAWVDAVEQCLLEADRHLKQISWPHGPARSVTSLRRPGP